MNLSGKKKNILGAKKNISEFSLKRFAFGPESGRVEETISELELKSETMAIQIAKMEAKAGGQISNKLIILIFKLNFFICKKYLNTSDSQLMSIKNNS